jgi:hypothetical protein
MPDLVALIAVCVLFAAAFAYMEGCERLGAKPKSPAPQGEQR